MSSLKVKINVIFRSLLIEFQRYYPEFLDSLYVLSTPMFFQDYFESEIRPHLS